MCRALRSDFGCKIYRSTNRDNVRNKILSEDGDFAAETTIVNTSHWTIQQG